MNVQIASEPGRPDEENADFTAAAPGLLIVVDGTETPPDAETGCQHSVAWYARHLGGLLLAAAANIGVGLGEALAIGIERINALHAWTCDLSHPGSPSAAVALARVDGERLEHLVLSDAVLVLDRPDQPPAVITDDRLAKVITNLNDPGPTARRNRFEQLAPYRNQPGGFWVASTKPEAAGEALTGSTPLSDLDAVAMLSDGATQLADRFNLMSWPELLAVLRKGGPAELITRTREAEASDPTGTRWPRARTSDDASAIWWTTAD